MGVIGRAELVFEDDHSSADVTGENVSVLSQRFPRNLAFLDGR